MGFLPLGLQTTTVARRKIKIDPEFDFLLLGIVTPLQDYRLAWFINNTLFKTLAKQEDLVLTDPVNRVQRAYSRFDFYEALTKSTFHLLQNKHAVECLMPELKDIDYLLLIKGDYYRSRKAQIAKKIRSIEHIQAVVILEVETLRSKNNIVIEGNE